jgi:hypothetical protein
MLVGTGAGARPVRNEHSGCPASRAARSSSAPSTAARMLRLGTRRPAGSRGSAGTRPPSRCHDSKAFTPETRSSPVMVATGADSPKPWMPSRSATTRPLWTSVTTS